MKMDLHLHSNYSDGKNSLEEMIEQAYKLGIKKIRFVDHVWKSSEWINAYIEELSRLKVKYASLIDIQIGVESKLINHSGDLDLDTKYYNSDIKIVAAIHRIPLGNENYIRGSEIQNDIELSKSMWMKSFKSFLLNKNITCIAHPFSLFQMMEIKKDDKKWWAEISSILEKVGCEIEYNVKYDNSMVPEWIWERFSDKIVFGSDSHSTSDLVNRNIELYNIQCKYQH